MELIEKRESGDVLPIGITEGFNRLSVFGLPEPMIKTLDGLLVKIVAPQLFSNCWHSEITASLNICRLLKFVMGFS